jgi:hypothetical protein
MERGAEIENGLGCCVLGWYEFQLESIDPEIGHLPHGSEHRFVRISNPYQVDKIRGDVEEPLVGFARIEPKNDFYVDVISLKLSDDSGDVVDSHFGQILEMVPVHEGAFVNQG